MTVCVTAVWRGRDEERLATAAILADWALAIFVYRASQETQWGILMIDCAQCAVFLWIALRSPRYWPLPLAAFGLLELLTHLAHAADTTVSGWAYITAEMIWSYLLLFTVGYASWTAPRYAESTVEPTALPPGAIRR
ncbi:MAG: hypothetical protein JF588_10130 [Caulobacterales bacterium]|nr:hypothetical protein [Caulobacterales bacterium]